MRYSERVSKMGLDKYSIGVSDDVAGILGRTIDAIKFWRFVLGHEDFGIEVIGSRAKTIKDFSLSQVIGVHGRTFEKIGQLKGHTFLDSLLLLGVNVFMYTTEELIELCQQIDHSVYLNLHEPAAKEFLKEVVDNGSFDMKNTTLVIEDDPVPGSLNHTERLRRLFPDTGMVFDLEHVAKDLPGFNWNTGYPYILRELKRVRPDIVHIPLGTRRADSLPSDIPLGFLHGLMRLQKEIGFFPVIEAQLGRSFATSTIWNTWQSHETIVEMKERIKPLFKN